MRILHILDSKSRQCSPITLRLIASAIDASGDAAVLEHTVWLMGHMPDDWLGSLAGDPRVEKLNAPFGRAMLATVSAVGRKSELGHVDGIQCWSLGALALAHTLFPLTEKVLMITTPPGGRWADQLRGMLARLPGLSATLRVVSLTRTWQRELASMPGLAIQAMRPGIVTQPIDEQSGTERDPDRPLTVAMFSDDPADPRCDTRVGIMALGIACRVLQARREASGRVGEPIEHQLLVHPLQAFRREAQVLLERFGGTWRLVQDARVSRPWDLGGEVDVAMLPCGLGVCGAWAASRGMAMAVATDADVTAEADPRGGGDVWADAVYKVAGGQRAWAAAMTMLLSEKDEDDQGVALRRRLGQQAQCVAGDIYGENAWKRGLGELWTSLLGVSPSPVQFGT